MESIAKVIEDDARMGTDLLIELGAASERALERASIRLMQIGEFAFDALGYRLSKQAIAVKRE
jgi:hypothetical protein